MTVSFDASSQGSVNSAASLTFSHTVGSGSDRALYVFAACPNSSDFLAAATVTYGGTSLGAPIASALSSSNFVYVWRITAPASGAANIVITPSASAYIRAYGVSLAGVSQTTPNGTPNAASSLNASPSNLSVTLGTGGMAIDMFSNREASTAVAPVAGQTLIGTEINAGVSRCGASYKAGSGSTSMGWTFFGGSFGASIVVPVNAADLGGTAPAITTQPSNASVAAGATATFTAAASGSPAPTYQWQRNPGGVGSWADIASATSASYTTPATTVSGGSANNGDTYRVVATNASGSATSTAATLTVGAANAAPTFAGPSISNLSLSQGVAMTAVNVASKFSDTDALTYSAVGTWPAGVTVSSAGVISGTPTVVGNYTGLTVRATDTAAQTVDSNTFSIAVTAVTATLNFQAAGMEFGARTGLGISTFALDVGSGYRYTVHADGLTLGTALYTSGVVNTDSAGKLPNLVDASITAGVTYRVHAVRQSDGAAATFRMTAA